MSRPSGDQAGAKLGRHGATSEIHGSAGTSLASWRSCPPSAAATMSWDESVGVTRVRRNAMRRPSGAHEMGLATSAMNSLGVPPRKGTRHTSGRRAGCLAHEIDRGAIGREGRTQQRHPRLWRHDLHVARGRRLAKPQAVVVAVVLHVRHVSPVWRDGRPFRRATRRQLRDLEIGKRADRGGGLR